MSMTRFRSYSELERLSTFDERYEYLRLDGQVGRSTFGFDRYINQNFYSSYDWKRVREQVIYRDDGCDLGVPGYEIHSGILIHHINPMRVDDVIHGAEWLIDPEYLITTTQRTHNAIHYSDISLLPKIVVARSPGDTRLW